MHEYHYIRYHLYEDQIAGISFIMAQYLIFLALAAASIVTRHFGKINLKRNAMLKSS